MQTRMSRQIDGEALRNSTDSSSMSNWIHKSKHYDIAFNFDCRRPPTSLEDPDQHHSQQRNLFYVLLWLQVVPSQTESMGLRFGRGYGNSWHCSIIRKCTWTLAKHGLLFSMWVRLCLLSKLQAEGPSLSSNFRRDSIRYYACRRRAVRRTLA